MSCITGSNAATYRLIRGNRVCPTPSPSPTRQIANCAIGLQHPLAYAMVPKLNLLEVHYEAHIAALEDKIVQAAVVAVLTPIYEAEFLGFSVLQRHVERRPA